jgi:hypothetical protein
MWPSLPTANHIADWANIFFIGGLVVGVVSTVLIVWMANVKEGYWELARQDSDERIAQLNKGAARLSAEAESAKGEIAKANQGAAEANARALEAKLALEKYKQPRLLSERQISTISEKLKPFAGTKFDAAVIPGDPEAFTFLAYIAATLEMAGWVWVEWAAPEGQIAMTYTIPSKPSIGQLGFLGTTLQINPAHAGALSTPADALGLALIGEGVEVTLDVIDNASVPNRETVHVIVGKKRQ